MRMERAHARSDLLGMLMRARQENLAHPRISNGYFRTLPMDSKEKTTPIDLLEYAMDKPVGAVRAALRICLDKTEVGADAVIATLEDDMEYNQEVLKDVLLALRKNPKGLLRHMPLTVKEKKLMIDLGL